MSGDGSAVRLRLSGELPARRRLAALLRRRPAITLVSDDDSLVVDLPLAHIERTGPSIEARAVQLGLELRLADLDAVVPPSELDGYGSRIWAALGDAYVRNELARARGDQPSTDVYAFVHVDEANGGRIATNARQSWDPPPRDPFLGPPSWDDVPSMEEVEAAIGVGPGIVTIELQPDGPPIIGRLQALHDDPELEARLPSNGSDSPWDVQSYRDPADRRLRRGIRELGVDRRATSEAFAIHGHGRDTRVARLHRVPGVPAGDLVRVFSTTVLGSKRAPWLPERVSGIDVLVARDRIDDEEQSSMMTAEHGLVAIFGGPRPAVEAMLMAFVTAGDRSDRS